MENVETFFENLLDTYETRIRIVSEAMRNTVDHLRDLSVEQAKMAVELRESLAIKRSFRKRDFDSLFQDIVLENLGKEKDISRAMENLRKEQESMSTRLRKIITGEEQITLSGFRLVGKEIIERLSEREKEVSDMLRRFHIEQSEVSNGLRRLVDKGDDVKIGDFKVMTEAMQIRQEERNSEVGRLLYDLEEGKQEINMQWEDLRRSYVVNYR